MHSNSHTHDADNANSSGVLYVVATPIGNRDDITLRALHTLAGADTIAAEDTRVTGKLLKDHGLRGQLVSYHEHNEDQRTPELLQKLKNGLSVALVSDAGTPSVSDPGYRLIEHAIAAGIQVVPVPGVSAVITALSVSGLPTDSFVFVGFLPRKPNRRMKLLRQLTATPRTLIFYEAPLRIAALIEDIISELGDRNAMLAREMTKAHEEYVRGRMSDIREVLAQRSRIRGECTLLVAGREDRKDLLPSEALAALQAGLDSPETRFSALVKQVASDHQLPKNTVYAAALKLRQSR